MSRAWRELGSSSLLWGPRCRQMWADKVYVPPKARADLAAGRAFAAFGFAVADARRSWITAEELCSFEWSHRMKGWSGESWTEDDPWWNGRPARRRHFRRDGSSVSLKSDGAVDGARQNSRWRFISACCGHEGAAEAFEPGVRGAFIRNRRDAREFPSAFVMRYPANWGFVLNQCWGFSTSFEMPPRGAEPALEDDHALVQAVSVETQYQEAQLFNAGMRLPDPDDPDAATDPVPPDNRQLVQIGAQHFLVNRDVLQVRLVFSSPSLG